MHLGIGACGSVLSLCLKPAPLPGFYPGGSLVKGGLAAYSQGLDGLQRGEEPFADGLELVVIQGKQAEALQVLERVDPQAVDLVGVQEAASQADLVTDCPMAPAKYPIPSLQLLD